MKSNHTTGALVDGKLRTINEFSDTDRKLDFRCTKCKEPIILRLRKTRNQSHFAHKPDSNCADAQESVYHLLAKEVLKETKTLYFPEVSFKDGNEIYCFDSGLGFDINNSQCLYGWVNSGLKKTIKQYESPEFKEYEITSIIRDVILPIQPKAIKSKLISFDRIEIEDEFDDEEERTQKSVFYKKYGFIPDAVGYVKDKQGIEKEVIIEFYCSHKVDEIKLNKIKEQNLPCIEIDISKIELDREVFKKYLANKECKSIYLNNPKADELKSNFIKTIEEKVKEEVEKINLEIKEKEDKIGELKNLNFVQIPSSLNFGFDMEKFCPRNSEKKAEYKTSRYYRDSIVKDIIEGGWNLSRDYDRSYRYENIIGMTLHKDKEMRKIKYIGRNFKEFFSDYYFKMWTTKGCKTCKFYKEIDHKNEFCGSPDVKPFVDPYKDIDEIMDSNSYNYVFLNNLGEVINPPQNQSINLELTGKRKFNQYNIENREDFFK